MGKKTKVGKFRKDKFYKLAKETGFRSRAAFKLIQLNRKFGFLQQSQVCIDLCAAPGGWMQVAKQNMPVSSIVVGVDLYPIRAIPGCISLTEDITTDKCKQALTKELQSWKADIVLHDGAPNVGTNWLYDAYQQICLTLNALKLATQFLRSGGWFVTKIFRSKDYNALLWVLKQLFKRVHATKPSASRKESAEIFVVCQYYIAPDKIDPKFLDAKYVFEELDLVKNKVSIMHPEKQKRLKAEGYTDDEFAMRNELSVSKFISVENGITVLQGIIKIVFDDEKIENHKKTTNEIKECCKDIKVLGRKDLRQLLNWRKQLHEEFIKKDEDKAAVKAEDVIDVDKKVHLSQDEIEEMEIDELEKHIEDIKIDEMKDAKRLKKRANKMRAKLNEKLSLKMVLKGDEGPHEEADQDVFALKGIKNKEDLLKLDDQAPDVLAYSDDSDNEFIPKYKRYEKGSEHLDDDGLYQDSNNSDASQDEDKSCDDSDFEANNSKQPPGLGFSDNEENSDSADAGKAKSNKLKKKAKNDERRLKNDSGGKKNDKNPLIDDLDIRDKNTKREQRVQLWYEKDKLKSLINSDQEDDNDENDEDYDLDKMSKVFRKNGIQIVGETNVDNKDLVAAKQLLGKKSRKRAKYAKESDSDTNDEETDSDYNTDENNSKNYDVVKKVGGKEGYEVVNNVKRIKLSPEELALGTLMIKSRKIKRDLIDNGWNRYAFNDKENLPDWFRLDEENNMKLSIPTPKELIDEYKKNLNEINIRPMKKVMEAKARKKRRAIKKLDKAKKKAESILDNVDASAQEKTRQLKKLYKKASEDPKKEVTYVVAKKHQSGKRAHRPAGVKGRFKVVDPRMKKDVRAKVRQQKASAGKSKGRKPQGGGGRKKK